jgi:ArsR family transcriptional regulator
MPEPVTVERLAETFKALGDPTRVRMLSALSRAELCVCDLATLLGATESAISHQLRLLRSLRVVRARRDGRMVFYRLDDDHIVRFVGAGSRARRGNARRPPRIADVSTVRERAACTVCEVHAESTFRVEGMDCHEEVALISRRLKRLSGLEASRPTSSRAACTCSTTPHGSRRAASPQRSPTPACVRGSSTKSLISPQPARLASWS